MMTSLHYDVMMWCCNKIGPRHVKTNNPNTNTFILVIYAIQLKTSLKQYISCIFSKLILPKFWNNTCMLLYIKSKLSSNVEIVAFFQGIVSFILLILFCYFWIWERTIPMMFFPLISTLILMKWWVSFASINRTIPEQIEFAS
jgi:hypothetical protein